MKAHGGQKHRDNASAFLAVAQKLHQTTKLHRQVYMNAGSAVEAMMLAIGLKSRELMTVPGSEQGGRWHNLEFLAKQHRILVPLKQDMSANRQLAVHWLTVRDWKSEGRFADVQIGPQDALDLLNAVAHKPNGMFLWLLNRFETI